MRSRQPARARGALRRRRPHDARDVGALRRLLRDPRVDPRMAARAERPDMRTALSIAKSDAYPTAVTADSNTRTTRARQGSGSARRGAQGAGRTRGRL